MSSVFGKKSIELARRLKRKDKREGGVEGEDEGLGRRARGGIKVEMEMLKLKSEAEYVIVIIWHVGWDRQGHDIIISLFN